MIAARGLRPASELGARRNHGDRLRYLGGCKCFKCRRANSDYERTRAAARAAGDWNGIVSAERARLHLVRLARAGVGRRSVMAASDVAQSVLQEIRQRKRLRIRARTERKILAVTPECRGDHSVVPAGKAWRLLEQLLTEGFSKAELARRMGFRTPAIQLRRDRITARSEQRVVAMHSRLMT